VTLELADSRIRLRTSMPPKPMDPAGAPWKQQRISTALEYPARAMEPLRWRKPWVDRWNGIGWAWKSSTEAPGSRWGDYCARQRPAAGRLMGLSGDIEN
jgi:hypothetical protein